MASKKVKNFIIDTNVILYSPNCLETFDNNNIILPAVVLEEVDSFKKNLDLNGYNARSFIRIVEKYREEKEGDLLKGVKLDSGGKFTIRFQDEKTRSLIPAGFDLSKNDNIILATALQVKLESKLETIIVSKDVNLRIKANAVGLDAEDYYHEKTTSFIDQSDDTLFVLDDYINTLYQEKELPVPEGVRRQDNEKFAPRVNEYFILKGEINPQKSALVRYIGNGNPMDGAFRLLHQNEPILGVTPANRKQIYLMDSLLDPDIDVVFAIGIAGTGKTLLALCAGLHSVLNDKYKRLIVTRSPIPMGRDLGYLPGNINEKLDPWLKPIYDNMEFIVYMMDKGRIEVKDEYLSKNQMHEATIDYLKASKMLEIEALTYIRGRTLMDTYLVVDEAQNLSPHEIKTIITRAGVNSKMVFTGDLKQIDNPYLNERDNGLVNASEKFTYARFKHASTIYLDKGERSRLATIAAEIL
ncbi:PhoH family protein [Seleniivibrio sp.]|uniref:PhoH family protein n=1 Tax=Seleniivibrio sp. TaxID=2898801 RepID=UPI0025DFFBE0|nr:PhoH family protein [Seleniivibrio sp.]MCD8553014.1 PhoH family protein [Seleniivibrio sp.]